ncbi:MAG: adenylate/guanylate cyclase domain-containing protein [Alphaproteobacteria bacterium]|nr:MAG: adenylate/guanylate cyclase domain-containing protein [Alphaproteobacteria bacterium]
MNDPTVPEVSNDERLPEIPLSSWSRHELASWLANHDGQFFGAMELLNQLCRRLIAIGLPIARVNLTLRDAHPQIAARAFIWNRDVGSRETTFPVQGILSQDYLDSPIAVIHNGASGVRRRLEGEDAQIDFPVLWELKKEGITDYVAMPLVFSDRSRHYISWSSDRPGGFHTDELTFLYDLMPLICLRLEVEHSRLVTRTLLNTYLGGGASERVIRGHTQRNVGEVIDAIIVYSDLRGFTQMADTLPPDEVIRVLGDYYEAVAKPIEARGGDIIKMIGDGLLAIFPYDNPMNGPCENTQAREAVEAVEEARVTLENIPSSELPEGIDKIRAGFAMHIGPVTFGNVGSSTRLDFTVIGPAVNEATRVEALTKTLGYPVLATQAFARLDCNSPFVSLGEHALRGVRERQEIFTTEDVFSKSQAD